MTDYSDVPIVYTGDWIDAAWLNQYIGDNLRAFKQGLAVTGDIPYALDTNTIAALNKPSVDSIMKMTGVGVPSWLAMAAFPGRLHTLGNYFSNSNATSTSTSYVAIGAGLTFNLTLTQTCTILAFAFGRGYKDSGGYDGNFGIRIDGTQDPNDKIAVRATTQENFSTWYYRTGIAAGTRAVELRYKTANAGDAVGFTLGGVFAMAFVE